MYKNTIDNRALKKYICLLSNKSNNLLQKSTFIALFLFVFRLVACAPLTGSSDSHHRQSLETLIFNNVDNLSFQNCGKVTIGEPFPWDVQLNYDDNLACSGVLISSRDVIASKCLRA
jgi:hypothetical protein